MRETFLSTTIQDRCLISFVCEQYAKQNNLSCLSLKLHFPHGIHSNGHKQKTIDQKTKEIKSYRVVFYPYQYYLIIPYTVLFTENKRRNKQSKWPYKASLYIFLYKILIAYNLEVIG